MVKKKERGRPKQKIDKKRLEELLESGQTDLKELQRQFENVGIQALKMQILDVMLTTGRVYKLTGTGKASNEVKHGKGGIRLSNALLENHSNEKDKYKVTFAENQIILTKE